MKYCIYCGKQLDDKAVVCTGCGCPTDEFKSYGATPVNVNKNVSNQVDGKYSNPLATAGLVLSLIAPAILVLQIIKTSFFWEYSTGILFVLFCAFAVSGLVCSSVALSKARKSDKMRGKGCAIAGVVISCILLGVFLLYFLGMLSLVGIFFLSLIALL